MDEQEHIWSVRELNEAVKQLLEGVPVLRRIRVCGEVTNCHENGISGHWYFTLREGTTKKNEYAVRCVLWKWDAARVRCKPKNGERFVVTASVTVYVNGGDYQLRVTDLEPEGLGDKQRARQELMAQLADMGYFDPARKKPLPRYPGRIGVITSATGDAVRDVIATLRGRWLRRRWSFCPCSYRGKRPRPASPAPSHTPTAGGWRTCSSWAGAAAAWRTWTCSTSAAWPRPSMIPRSRW